MRDDVSNNTLAMLRAYLQNTPDNVFYKDKNLVYTAASLSFAHLISKKDPSEIVGKTDFDIFSPELAERYIEDDLAVLYSGIPIIDRLEPIPSDNGTVHFSNTSKFLVRNEQGEVIGLYGVSRDITAQVELMEEKENRALSQQMYDDVWMADLTLNKMIRTEKGIFKFLEDFTFSDAVFTVTTNSIHPNHRDSFAKTYDIDYLLAQYAQGKTEFSHITYMKDARGDYRWVEFYSKLYHSKVSDTLRISSFLSDQDKQVREQQQLRQTAETDSLTGLLNHKSVVQRITKTLGGFERHMKHALLFIDLDGFKNVNDNFGHPYGDNVLQRTTLRLKEICSATDLIGRIGGDEFLIFMKNIHSKESVERFARSVLTAVKTECNNDECNLSLTCSVGIAIYSRDYLSFDELYRRADEAMYKAKALGKDGFAFYE